MVNEPQRIDFEQFKSCLQQIFDQVKRHNQPVLVERDGQTYRIEMQEAENIWEGYDPDKVRQGIRKAAGVLAGVDREELLRDIQAQRQQGPGRLE